MGLRRLAYTLCRAQVDQLPVAACLELLTQLGTGVSEHEQLQALGSSLLAAACTRVAKLLSEDAALRGNADVQAQLLAFLGPLQHMLNDTRRRELFVQLPFQLLRVRVQLGSRLELAAPACTCRQTNRFRQHPCHAGLHF